MELNTKYRIAMSVIAILCVACVALGAAVFQAQKTTTEPATDEAPLIKDEAAAWKNFDTFFQNLNQQFQTDRQHAFSMLDNFFNDDFFTNTDEPFKEMEKMHQEMMQRMEKSFKGAFDDSWDTWFNTKFTNNGLLSDGSRLSEQTEETKDAYIYRFTAPDLKGKKLNVKIDDRGITIQGDYVQQTEKTDKEDKVIARQEARRSIYERFSIPEDADVQKAEINNNGNEVTVRLPKKSTS